MIGYDDDAGVIRLTVIAVVVAVVALFGLGWWLADRDEREWDNFSRNHRCVLVGVKEEQIGTSVVTSARGTPGVGMTFIPSQRGYRCDDGVTYWREEE